jgi:hypothetical protein
MPSRSESWSGLFKDEQYRLIRSSRTSIRWLRVFEQTTPPLRGFPSLLRRGMAQNRTYGYQHRAQPLPVVAFRFEREFILDSSALLRRGICRCNGDKSFLPGRLPSPCGRIASTLNNRYTYFPPVMLCVLVYRLRLTRINASPELQLLCNHNCCIRVLKTSGSLTRS